MITFIQCETLLHYLAKDVGGVGGYSDEFPPPQLSARRIGRDIDDIDGDDDEGGYRGDDGPGPPEKQEGKCSFNKSIVQCFSLSRLKSLVQMMLFPKHLTH